MKTQTIGTVLTEAALLKKRIFVGRIRPDDIISDAIRIADDFESMPGFNRSHFYGLCGFSWLNEDGTPSFD